jgi:26S proteasome regulatory subunit N4
VLYADTMSVRTTRARIIHLKNDYKELMNGIEKGLHQYHASSSLDSEGSKEAQPSSIRHTAEEDTQTSNRTTPDPPFAKVNSIAPSSPAQEAGLKVGDKIRNFGPVRWTNHENLQKVAEVVQRSEGVSRSQTIHFVLGLTKAL